MSPKVHFRSSFAPPVYNFFFYSTDFDTSWNAGSFEYPDAIFNLKFN